LRQTTPAWGRSLATPRGVLDKEKHGSEAIPKKKISSLLSMERRETQQSYLISVS
jgi:hypothetical protein